MTYLLDTHYMLWAIADTAKISRNIKQILTNPDNTIIVSVISFWEISLKSSLGKIAISGLSIDDLPAACAEIGFTIEPLSATNSSTYHLLTATYHKDPFDRMLIWQAIRNQYTLISKDRNIAQYTSEGLKVINR